MIEQTLMASADAMSGLAGWLLAQTTAPTTPGAPGGPPPSGWSAFLQSPLPMILLMFVVFWWVMSSGRRREQKRFQEMLNSLKRNDRVLTIGGVVGTVVEVRDDVVILKVDESSNTKMQFVRSAVKDVLRDAPTAGAK